MKLLMTADTVGGVWTYAVELARAFQPYGVEVLLATMGRQLSHDQRKDIAPLTNVHLCESEFKLEWMDDPWTDVNAAGQWLLELESKFQPDLAHLNGYVHAALPWSVPKLVVCHSCVMSWWLAVKNESAPDSLWSAYRNRVTLGIHAADYLVAPSKAMLDSIKTLYGNGSGRSKVIPNGRDSSYFSPAPKKPYIFCAGRLWDEAKNVAALKRIAEQLPWPVYAAGENRHRTEIAQISAENTNYHPVGQLSSSQIAQWLSEASIYCLPARYEPFGFSALEAALSGCALVLGDIPSLREIWGGSAIFVSPNDDEALAAALHNLIRNSGYREKYAQRARLRAMEFTPARMAGCYMEIYAAMLSPGRQPRAGLFVQEMSACA